MSVRTFKIFVQSQPNSIEVARYIDEKIRSINDLGIRIKMVKIMPEDMDEDLIRTFKRLGITRFPAMLTNSGRTYIGVNQIVDVFKRGLNSKNKVEGLIGPGPIDGGTATDTQSFWMKELYAGYDSNGRPIPRTDPDEGDGENGDIERRMREYQQNIPAHRRVNSGRAPALDDAPAGRPRRRTRATEPTFDDNVADDEDGFDDMPPPPASRPRNEPRGGNIIGLSGDAMDKKMLDAWLANNPGSSDY